MSSTTIDATYPDEVSETDTAALAPLLLPLGGPPVDDPPPVPVPRVCTLSHPGFTAMGPPTFRRSDTGEEAVMTVTLGTQQAVFPLGAIQRAFGIAEGSADERMLGMINEALNFVPVLRLGDSLPSEVVTGEASWSASPSHHALAGARLRMNLVAWLGRGEPDSGSNPDPEALIALVEDPGFRPKLVAAFRSAAVALDLPGPEAVVALLSRLADELAYIEAMRERLLERLQRMADDVAWVARTGRCGWQRAEMMLSIRRLMTEALELHRRQFDDIDRQTGHVIDALRDLERDRLGLRSRRDAMFTGLRRWEWLMTAWEGCRNIPDAELSRLIDQTYRFLARRLLPGDAWSGLSKAERPRQMSW